MSRVKQVVLLLMLAALGSNAAPDVDCDGLNKTLPAKDLHKIAGNWVLVWSVAETPKPLEFLKELSSSYTELQILPDNNTVIFTEWNMMRDKGCTKYLTNITVTSDPNNTNHHILETTTGVFEEKGAVGQYNDSGSYVFFETCSNCLMMDYKGSLGHYLLSYRRDGHHQDVEQLKAAQSDHEKLAECVGLSREAPFIYDGTAEFCSKKSSEATADQS